MQGQVCAHAWEYNTISILLVQFINKNGTVSFFSDIFFFEMNITQENMNKWHRANPGFYTFHKRSHA